VLDVQDGSLREVEPSVSDSLHVATILAPLSRLHEQLCHSKPAQFEDEAT
jgi:hypothetical protein